MTTVQDDGVGVFRRAREDFGYATPHAGAHPRVTPRMIGGADSDQTHVLDASGWSAAS